MARKSFSGADRKAIVPLREPNGQKQRATRAERREGVRAVAFSQPHRRGDDPARPDPRRSTPLGRLFAERKIRHASATPLTLSLTADYYLDAHSRYRRVIASGRPLATIGGPSGADIAPAQAEKWQAEWEAIGRALRGAGVQAQKAVEYVLQDSTPTDDERLYPTWITRGLSDGLAALARHFGFVK
jgi:hypothetical protein